MLMLTVQEKGFGFPEHKDEIIQLYLKLMQTVTNPIGLHVHFSKGSFAKMASVKKLNMLKYGVNFMKKYLHIKVKDFYSGWSLYDNETVEQCKQVGLTNFHYKVSRKPTIPDGVIAVPIRRWIHDFQIKGDENA